MHALPYHRVLTCSRFTVRLVPRHLRDWRHVRRDAAHRLVRPARYFSRAYTLMHGLQERGQARLEPEPRARRVHRAVGGRDVDACRVELDLHDSVHVEPARAGAHARQVRFAISPCIVG